jgi:hypothetical protein
VSQRQPLSEIAYKALEVTHRRAVKNGLDPFEELNRVGLVATEPRIREIQVSILENLSDRLEQLNMSQILMQQPHLTVDDMLRYVRNFLTEYIAMVKNS